MTQRTLRYMAVDDLPPHPDNPKGHALRVIEESMDRFGYTTPILICERTRQIVEGHGRREALIAKRDRGEQPPDGVSVVKGVWRAPVIRGWSSKDDDELRSYLVASNRLTMLGGWEDEKGLLDILRRAQKSEHGLSGIGYEDKEIVQFLARLGTGTKGKTDPDEVPEPKSTVSKLGDVWTLGEHRVMCGDATSTDDLAKLLDGGSPSLLVTDPPYGVAIGSKNATLNEMGKGNPHEGELSGDEGIKEVETLWRAAFPAMRSVLPPGTPYYIFGPQGGELGLLLLRESNLAARHILIWRKNRASFSIGRLDYDYAHEPIAYGWTAGGSHPWFATDTQTSVIDCDRPTASKLHPTMKPVELIERLITNSSPHGGVVLDPFGGSGSTLIACEQSGRAGRLMEITPGYVDVTVERWQDFTGQKAKKAR